MTRLNFRQLFSKPATQSHLEHMQRSGRPDPRLWLEGIQRCFRPNPTPKPNPNILRDLIVTVTLLARTLLLFSVYA